MSEYAVVEFTDDSSVDVVPCCWLDENYCFWPPYRNERLLNSVKKSELPQGSWDKYGIRVLHAFGMYDCFLVDNFWYQKCAVYSVTDGLFLSEICR